MMITAVALQAHRKVRIQVARIQVARIQVAPARKVVRIAVTTKKRRKKRTNVNIKKTKKCVNPKFEKKSADVFMKQPVKFKL